MNKEDFIDIWTQEKGQYKAWAEFVIDEICTSIKAMQLDPKTFLKTPVDPRLKEDGSLIDKAFYRKKNYCDPYNEIEDKVGCRFVVLLIDHIEIISKIIKESSHWHFDECRNYNNEREKDPLLFTYQSMHYIVRPNRNLMFRGISINKNTTCEIQIRTLLQHAYAELTHDAIYKSKKIVKPTVQRTVAKSMALIETTDDFFKNVNDELNMGICEDNKYQVQLNNLYLELIGINPNQAQGSSTVILDEYEEQLTHIDINMIKSFWNTNTDLLSVIKIKAPYDQFYTQSIVLALGYMIKRNKTRLTNNWPLSNDLLDDFATDMGISLESN